MRINNNIPALKTLRKLESTNKSLSKSIQKLSTGLRINSAADDAAGFAISEKMRSQISGLDIAIKNSQDGISFLQTAEGALGDVNSILQRMRELSVQASNDSLTSNDRQYIQLEIDELRDQINRIAGTTQFNRKRILDGSSGALWSSSDLNVKARINGGLTYTDQFGQKVSSEGNYRIEVTTEPGQPQVQKSNIINQTVTLKEIQSVSFEPDLSIFQTININTGTDSTGAVSGDGWDFAGNTLTINGDGFFKIEGTGETTFNHIVVSPDVNAKVMLSNVNINVNSSSNEICAFDMTGATVDMYLDGTNSLVSQRNRAAIEVPEGSNLTISSAKGDGKTSGSLLAGWQITDFFDGNGAGIGGAFLYEELKGDIQSYVSVHQPIGSITINGGTITAGSGFGPGIGGSGDGGSITINGGNVTAITSSGISAGIGSSSSRYVTGNGDTTNSIKITITGGMINAKSNWSAAIGGGYASDSGMIRIRNGMQNFISTVGPSPMYNSSEWIGRGEYGTISDVKYLNISQLTPRKLPWSVPVENINAIEHMPTLPEIPQFYNTSGAFLVSQPQTLTITQGDGKTASITLYETDTMPDVAAKINDAIANSLGQAKYTDNPGKFCTISDGTEGTSESVYEKTAIYDDDGNLIGYDTQATMLIRSAIPGKIGELSFSGDEDLLNALGLNTIQPSSESTYTASVYDAHSGKAVAVNVKSSDNEFPSLIPPEIDIRVDAMAGLKSTWNESTKAFMLVQDDSYSAMIHLKDNTTIFQTGANQGEDFIIQLGDTSSFALGIDVVNLLTRENASRSIGILDRAISKVSSQRAKIGAYNNALDYTMENLTTTSANLTDAESRIRDADMAQEYMDFVKWQILNQSGTSMLAQANNLPQSVMSLLQ